MKIEVLEEFVRLARNLHFRETAAELFISEAKLSKDIQALESELGYPLFERSRHGVALTQNGKKAFEKAQDVLDAYASLLHIEEHKPRSFSTALVTRFPAIADLYLETRERMCRKYPDVSFTDMDCSPSDNPLDLLTKNCDLALSAYVQNVPPHIVATELFDYNLCVWVSSESDVASQDIVRLRDLNEMVYVRTAKGSRDWDLYIQRLLRNEGVEFKVGGYIDGFFQLHQNEFTVMVDVRPDAFFGRGAKKLAIEPPVGVPIAAFSAKNSTSRIAKEFVATLEQTARTMALGAQKGGPAPL